MKNQRLNIRKARVHNLKDVSLSLEPKELVIFTGVSGSGKSSLAFDTIYVEGQRRYVESLSTFARRYLGDLAKPDVEHMSGVSPTISIEQKTAGRNPRSTVGTMTEVYDYLRVLFARVGIPHCPESGEPVTPQSRERIILTVQGLPEGSKIQILAPHARQKKGEFRDDFQELLRKGFTRVRVDGTVRDLNDEISLDGNLAHDVDVIVDRLVVRKSDNSRLAEALTLALDMGQGLCKVLEGEKETLFSMHAFSKESGISYDSLDPQDFSFNSPAGMCERCQGLGTVKEFDLDQIIDPDLSIAEDCCFIASAYKTVRYGNIYRNLARLYKFDVNTPWKDLSKSAQKIFLHGTKKKWVRMRFVHPVKDTEWSDYVQWRGVLHDAHGRYAEAKSESYRKRMDKLMTEQVCSSCQGKRLKAYPSATRLSGRGIYELTSMTILECLRFFEALELTTQEMLIAEELLKEITQRLQFLVDVGLEYLTIDRTAPTLSGGEAQRVRLASQIGCGLVGVTYVLDEPSIGLHPRDNRRLLQTLKRLRDKGNTVIVVEHDEETMWEADRIVDFGPKAGVLGGEIIVDGNIKKLLNSRKSLTAQYLRGDKRIPIPEKRRKPSKNSIAVKGAEFHNLKKANASFPTEVFIAVTGVSGSGKSSLISDILYPALANTLHKAELPIGKHREIQGLEHLDKVISIDQSPIGRIPRSNPSTYIKVFDEIRDLFAQLPESRARGYKPGRFSFNVKEGSCPQCQGMGQIKVDMDFMEDAWVDCSLCKTRRYDPETLSVRFKGKSIFDVLDMDVERAAAFFENIPSIHKKLETLVRVGMGYIKLGQPSTTLSGGEAQRIKLAKELVRPSTGKTLYILDEPTTGLHFEDIKHLLEVLHELVERGNTVLVIEHNMEVVKTADWIVDLGPEGGDFGGKVVAKGTPEKIAKMDTPTGEALRDVLFHDYEAKVEEALAAHQRNLSRRSQRKQEWVQDVTVEGAEQHNLKLVDASVPRGKITVCTGPSGSGKTSFALDTIYAEGQRRYIESLSPYARQFVKQMPKPKVRQVEGLSPAIAIEQKAHAGNPRSTVGTMTEIYDYLRVLFARIGIPHCPETGEVIQAISKEHVVERIMAFSGERLHIMAPLDLKKSDKFTEILARYQRQGFLRLRLNGEFHELDQEIPFDRRKKNEVMLVVDRLKVTASCQNRIFEAVENAASIAGGTLVVMREEEDTLFNLAFSVASTGKSYPEITPKTFAFNTPDGMCNDCQGLGYQFGANLTENPDALKLTLEDLLLECWGDAFTFDALRFFRRVLAEEGIKHGTRLRSLSQKQLQLFLLGSGDKTYEIRPGLRLRWVGLNHVLIKAAKHGRSRWKQNIISILNEITCPSCSGSRLNPLASCVTIRDQSIADLCAMPIGELSQFASKLELDEGSLLDETQRQLAARLSFLCEVGLDYISLDRKAPSLSGGESQRIKLARQLGSSLTGVLYVLDEPTIGLHPHDNHRLNQALGKLNALGNTLLLVEHDPQTVNTADYILDFGPQSGSHGGHVTARGTLAQIKRDTRSLTGAYLSGRRTIPLPENRRELGSFDLKVREASDNNLKGISVAFPTSSLSCITGVSGSGKSTLLEKVLHPALRQGIGYHDKVGSVSGIKQFTNAIVIDQKPIGHTSRSDVGSYCDVLPRMRQFFAELRDARTKGLQPKHFSRNHRAGMCSGCWGMGYKRIEMHFLPPVKIECPDCHGMRLNPNSLEVTYQGKNFGQYFHTTVEDAYDDFILIPKVRLVLETLISVGLGYLKIGQAMASLSGGEAQRIKLSRELIKRQTGQTIYLLDEPTTGLHADDIAKLLTVLHRLVDKGNTMIVIEHNLDFIRHADYIVDLGPEAGEKGGEVICTGRPEEVAAYAGSYTGQFLREVLD